MSKKQNRSIAFFGVPQVKAFEERLNAESWVYTQAEWNKKRAEENRKDARLLVRIKHKDQQGLIIPADWLKSVREIAH